MSELLRIAKGLKATYKNARDYTLSQALLEIEKYTDNYEVLNATHNRIYGDIDGKNIEGSEKEFNDLDMKTKDAIVKFLKDEKYCLLTASSFLHKKISWRFVITNRKTTLEDNKTWVQKSIELIDLPEGITFDTAPYSKNQKIRMVGSNKDGENRPLRLVQGDVVDSLISYIPEDCELMEFPKEKKTRKNKKENAEEKIEGKLLNRLVMNIKNDENTDWETWYKVAQAIYNEGGDEELFMAWSSKSPKHNDREALLQWKSLKDGKGDKLTAGSLYYWSQKSNPVEHEKIILDCCSKDQYQYQKIVFEKTHFLLKNPPRYVRQISQEEGRFEFLGEHEIRMLYRGKKCGDESFIEMWLKDTEHIRSYEAFQFKPQLPATPGYYNLWNGFPIEPKEGDWSLIQEIVWNLSGRNEEVYEYILNWSAHLFQKPYEKHGVMIIFSSELEGVGKDTYCDYVLGRLLGRECYYGSKDAENQIFGKFNSHLANKLLVKIEEMEYEVMSKHDAKFKAFITGDTMDYEEKGVNRKMPMLSYHRFIGTTNESCPVRLTKSFRRFCLINPYLGNAGNTAYWSSVYERLADISIHQAFLDFLMKRDISNWKATNKPETDALNSARTSQAPPHSHWFQQQVQLNEEEGSITLFAEDMRTRVNQNCKYPYSQHKFSQEIKQYPNQNRRTARGIEYTFNLKEIKEYLVSKHWWVDI